MHTKDPWTDLIGVKHKGIRPWTQESLKVCIEFHKLTVFIVDAAERLKYTSTEFGNIPFSKPL